MIVTVEAWASPPRIKIETTDTTVTRVQGSVNTPVRGTVEAGVIYDYEAPQQTSVTYDDGLAVSDPVELPKVGVWLIHLTDPARSCQVSLGRVGGWSSNAMSDTLVIPGRENPHTVSFGPRLSRAGSFTARTEAPDEETALAAVLADQSVLFLQSDHPALPSGYVTIGDVDWDRLIAWEGDTNRVASLPYTYSDRPDFIADDTLTWEDLPASWSALASTWDSLEKA